RIHPHRVHDARQHGRPDLRETRGHRAGSESRRGGGSERARWARLTARGFSNLGWEDRRGRDPFKQWWAAIIHGLEPREVNREASIQMSDYWLARLAGRLDWS